MSCSLQFFWRTNLLLCLGLCLHCGEARVHTEAQAGPLYRVVGSPLFIYCNVSGFSSATARQEFEFRVKRSANSKVEINIISTKDDTFSYNAYLHRVRAKEITLTHVSPNAVIFEIHKLVKEDDGEFECSVINSERVYNGIYTAKTTVKVIDNSLSVSSPASTSLSYFKGDALTLTCQASSNTIQHTHLSLTWYLHKDGEDSAQPIISLNRDFTLSPGQGFEGRYQTGLIRLDKIGEATYRLHMDQLELSDQGRIYCQAQEWIQDPDRSWYSIIQKDAQETTLSVKGKEVVPDTSSLVASISAQPTTLQEGQELSLTCNVDTQKLEERFFSVAWFRGSVELARVGPTGILSVGHEYSSREKEGELRAARVGNRDYRLMLRPVRTEDRGEYICRTWPQDRSPNGAFIQGAAQDSSPQLVRILATESGLSVETQNAVSVNEGDRLQISCKVHGVKDQLSITWQHKSTSTVTFTGVIGLTQEGVTEKAEQFVSREVKAARPASDTFTLELEEARPSDSGVYQCAVSEWENNAKTNSQAQTTSVTVVPVESFVKVHLISRNNIVTVGESVQLMCRVRGPQLPITLTWSLQRDVSTLDNILTLYYNGAISWSGDQHRYQLRVENKQNEVIHYLLISGASHREAGSYQCRVSVFLENAYKQLPPSNHLAVMVQKPVSKLKLTSTPTLTKDINTDIEIRCSAISEPSASSRYAVTWLLGLQSENKSLLSSDQDALVTFRSEAELSHRISMRRSKGPNFELIIRQARISDEGIYICEVVEWLQDPHGDWYQLPPVSTTTELTIIEPSNDLRLDKTAQQLIVKEGDKVEVECNIISGTNSPSFFYKVTWLYTGRNSSVSSSLVELDHTGLLTYPENQKFRGLQGRLRLSRPTQNSFKLEIQGAHEWDRGTYQCQVEQYQLDQEGLWKQKASDIAGPIMLTVNVTEQNLSIVKEEVELNVSGSQTFTIPCHIIKQSSSESEFQVTWFWQNPTETKQHPIFTSYRNSTLQDRFGKGDQLRFSHPFPNHFSLTVLKPGSEDSGWYFCEVEEWLPSLSHGWRKVAVEKSGNLTVNVFARGDVKAVSQDLECNVKIGILVPIVICALVVIFLLVLKMCCSKASGKKQLDQSLWADKLPLNTKPRAED